MTISSIQLSLFVHQINSLCGEMGAQLRHAAFSPNIRDRLDFSCAMFNAQGQMCAQAAHIPVHLGSMAFAMQDIIGHFEWQPGDVVIFNDPYLGGTHLPDVTIVLPVFYENKCVAFVANRAHHADIGSEEPGSMPLSSNLHEEGIVLSPQLIGRNNVLDKEIYQTLFSSVQNLMNTYADLNAQLGANIHGQSRLQKMIDEMGVAEFDAYIHAMFDYAHSMALNQLRRIPSGSYSAVDYMDDDGLGNFDIPIHVQMEVNKGHVLVDFSKSAIQVSGNINCPKAVTAAAVFYVFRCLMNDDVPACHAAFSTIKIQTESGSIVDANYPAAVAAGNVETSTRIVDVLFAALAQACPDLIPACSQGSMNNIAMGAHRGNGETSWSYYETMGGGAGANAKSNGLSAIQTHMTNTQNTPIEVLEMNYPVRVRRYEIRTSSGGQGQHAGGDGLIREFEFLQPAKVTILSERRKHAPKGSLGGGAGACGENYLNNLSIDGKVSLSVEPGDCVRIETPGGGAYGLLTNK